MKPRTIIPLVAGLGIGFVAIRMGRDMLQKAEGAQGPSTQVVVAAGTIEPASALTPQLVGTKKVPASLIPQGAFTDPKALVGRVSKSLVPQGVMLTEQMLAPPGTQPGLSSRIPDGFRAVSVKVDEASSVAGFLTPGSTVDVSAVMTERINTRERTYSRIILQNVTVGAVGQSLSSLGQDGKSSQLSRSVTLLLKPDDVPKLQMASTKGNIHLAMRNGREEDGGLKAAKSLFSALMERPKRVKAPPKPKANPLPKVAPPQVVDVYRGTQLERLVFMPSGEVKRIEGGAMPTANNSTPQPEPAPQEEKPAQEVGE